jgi:hypothetical protein
VSENRVQQPIGRHQHLCRLRGEVVSLLLLLLATGGLSPLAAQELAAPPECYRFSMPPVSLFPAAAEEHDSLAFVPSSETVGPGVAGADVDLLGPARVGSYTPLSPGEKFKLAMKNTFGPFAWGRAALGAGFSQWIDSEKGYGQGFDGYLRRFSARMAFNGTKQVVGTFALATALGQDPRYYPSPKRDPAHRIEYAISRVFVTRSDNGGEEFNTSLVGGNAAAALLSNTWYRERDRGVGETLSRFAFGLAWSAAGNLFNEFVVHRHPPRP